MTPTFSSPALLWASYFLDSECLWSDFCLQKNQRRSSFPPWQSGQAAHKQFYPEPWQQVRLKDLDLLKGFRGSWERFLIRLESGKTSVNEQLLQNQNSALISLPVSQTRRLLQLFVVIGGIFHWCGHGCEVFFPVWNLHTSLLFIKTTASRGSLAF